jgi:hypothetical protein
MVLNMIIEIEEVGWIRNGSGLFDTHCIILLAVPVNY